MFFIIFSVFLSALLELEKLEEVFPYLKTLLKNETYKSILRGILAPLSQSICFAVVPYILKIIAVYQGTLSKTAVDGWIIVRYSWFLIIQFAVIGLYPGKNLIEILTHWFDGKFKSNVAELQANLPSKAVFFINLIIQKTFVTLFMILTKPVPLVSSLWSDKTSPLIQSPLFHSIYPELIIFAYLMCMSFMIVTPIFLIFGIMFYLTAFVIFKANFIFTETVKQESGGDHWIHICNLMLIGIPLGQMFLLFQLIVSERIFESIIMLPLLLVTIYTISYFQNIFYEKGNHIALCSEEKQRVIATCQNARLRQDEILGTAEFTQNSNQIPIGEASPMDRFPAVAVTNPYREPFLLKSSSSMSLPPGFLALVEWNLENGCSPNIDNVLQYSP